jgi:hypothetical protein
MAKITGGDKLASVLSAIAAKASKAKMVSVGFLENSTYPNGVSTPMIAAIQEFGAPKVGIPPRPFFRNMIAAKKDEWPKTVGDLLIENDYDAARTLAQAGEGIKGELQASIEEFSGVPLSPVTVMLRGMKSQAKYRDFFGVAPWELLAEARERVETGKTNYGASTKPLVDTGHLLNSVDYEVE